ncbi:hypothetical protein LX13_003068 [Williamsia maris]|uniref:Tat (Twin-arginine translocation) pathway signal sequence n=1 Tax=Williamsia maris TaxID=72806 RepID=A0ABT1HI96_9NOCA|nr:hypothetical protein [Williamsia maris]
MQISLNGVRVEHDRARGSWMLAGLALLLGTAFVVAPVWLAGGGHGEGFFGSAALTRAVGDNFVAFWNTGDTAVPTGMNDLVQYWTRYHVAKAVLSGLLLIVLTVLAVRLWKPTVNSAIATRRRRMAGMAGATATAGGFGAALLLMANVQGAVAPLSSLLSVVPSASDDPAVGRVQAQVEQQLRTGDTSRPALARMVADFGTYHAVLAVAALVLACVAVGFSVVIGRSFVRTPRLDRATRRTTALASACLAIVGIGVIILAAANIGNAIEPAHALLLFYAG